MVDMELAGRVTTLREALGVDKKEMAEGMRVLAHIKTTGNRLSEWELGRKPVSPHTASAMSQLHPDPAACLKWLIKGGELPTIPVEYSLTARIREYSQVATEEDMDQGGTDFESLQVENLDTVENPNQDVDGTAVEISQEARQEMVDSMPPSQKGETPKQVMADFAEWSLGYPIIARIAASEWMTRLFAAARGSAEDPSFRREA